MKSAPYFLFFCHNYLLSAREFVILSYNKMNMVRSEIQNVKLRFGIIGNAEGLNRAIDVAIQVAPTDLSVLITGEVVWERKIFRRSSISSAVGNMDSI